MNAVQKPLAGRESLRDAQRVVLKIGTHVLIHDDGYPALARLFCIIEAAAALRRQGRDVLIVSSGAVGLGREALGYTETPQELDARQACAAVGQTRLMTLFQEGFSRLGLTCAQVLLNQGDFEHRGRYLNLRSTLLTLQHHGVIPIINENDAVSTEELAFTSEPNTHLVFGDNDKLSALVAAKLGADLLVLLTDVDGVYDRNPRDEPGASLLKEVTGEQSLELSGAGSSRGRGGMRSKVRAARIATHAGCHAVIASGLDTTALPAVLGGEDVGTWFHASTALNARSRWIAFAVGARGALVLDDGAIHAVSEQGASVLAAGVTDCLGEFDRGDVVELRNTTGTVLGRGIVFCDAPTARAWCGGQRPAGARNHHALVHRDHLVLGIQA